jgi:hypothetical protein
MTIKHLPIDQVRLSDLLNAAKGDTELPDFYSLQTALNCVGDIRGLKISGFSLEDNFSYYQKSGI